MVSSMQRISLAGCYRIYEYSCGWAVCVLCWFFLEWDWCVENDGLMMFVRLRLSELTKQVGSLGTINRDCRRSPWGWLAWKCWVPFRLWWGCPCHRRWWNWWRYPGVRNVLNVRYDAGRFRSSSGNRSWWLYWQFERRYHAWLNRRKRGNVPILSWSYGTLCFAVPTPSSRGWRSSCSLLWWSAGRVAPHASCCCRR